MAEQGAIIDPINLNSASASELAKIAEIGLQRARRIVEYRIQNGRFRSIEDLGNIPGFDNVVIDGVRSSVTV